MTREEFIHLHPIENEFTRIGAKLHGEGNSRTTNYCAKLVHKPGHLCVTVDIQRQLFNCNDCKFGGSVIDLLSSWESVSIGDFLKKHNIVNGNGHRPVLSPATQRRVIQHIYSYQNAIGREVYQVCRLEPKDFRQRHSDGKGGWIWNMEGIERVLYRLPEVIKSESVWIVEGEKDADSLAAFGICATCNVGGAGKWLDAYTVTLAGKDVVLCGDNDDPGQKHVEMVFDSISGKVKSAKLVKIPEPHKDVSCWIQSGATAEQIKALSDNATPFVKGIRTPIFSIAEIEPRYIKLAKSAQTESLNLARWLPSLGNNLRAIVPGEMILLIGDTGTGKTCWLQNLAMNCGDLPVLMFEMELPDTLLFERFVAIQTKLNCKVVEQTYADGETLGNKALDIHFPNVFVCSESRLDLETMEKHIRQSELKIGRKPKVVLLDYIQLLQGHGKRYERASDNAEGLKVLAKKMEVIMVVASQIARPDEEKPVIGLHSGKDSGALENSAGLVLGVWRDKDQANLLWLRVLKSTRGGSGTKIPCNFNGENMTITESINPDSWRPDAPGGVLTP